MSYKEKPQIKLYKYQNSAFVLQAIIDDYAECSFENNRFQAGQFSITINYNIPNASLFERGLFIQFSNNPYAFGEIVNITDSIDADGKGSQIRIITGYDARYIFKRRIIKNLNDVDSWSMTAKGEICMRNLIQDQCGSNAETKRQLPITNVIPDPANAIGSEYSVSESFTNLYEVLTTIATQTEIGWRLNFNGSALSLEFYEGTDRHQTVRFDTDFESLSNGEFTDSSESFANSIYVCGKGEGEERDMYEGESAIEGSSPSGLERYEAYDNQSAMTTESEYEAEALAMLSQYSQTLQVSGQGLAKCPYEYGKEYDVGDIITVAFSGKSAVVQILSVTEHWTWGNYNLEFTFGKPQPDLNKQLQLILKQIQKASSKTTATASVKWYTVTNTTSMQSGEVIYDTLGFTGNVGTGKTFTLYLDDEKTGSKNYNIYIRNLTGTGKLTLTTGKTGATDIQLATGDYVGRIFIDENGNIIIESLTATSTIESGSNQPATSGAVAEEIENITEIASSLPTDAVLHYSFDEVPDYPDGTADIRREYGDTFRNSTEYCYGNSTQTISNVTGNLHCISTVRYGGIYLRNDVASSKIVTVRVKVIKGTVSIGLLSNIKGVGTWVVSRYVTPSFYIVSATAEETEWELEYVYIGDGSYTTPIIDNANGQNNATNNGGLAVQGVSGKSVRFYGNGYLLFDKPNFTEEMTFSFWFKPNNTDVLNNIIVCRTTNTVADGGLSIYRSSGNYIGISIKGVQTNFTSMSATDTSNYHLFTIVLSTTDRKIYRDGELKETITETGSFITTGFSEKCWIGGAGSGSIVTPNLNGELDDLLIFDRALTDAEVMALYLNKGNTPKYYSWADWKLNQIENAQTRTVETKGSDEETDEEKPIEEEPKEEER